MMSIRSLRRSGALVRCKTGGIWFLGKGGVGIKPSPGSKHAQQIDARSCHWLTPFNRFSNNA
eukprot:6692369-Karenia_brevis.AAC.1